MPATTSHRLIAEYLRSLDTALKGLPRHSRREVLADVEQHITDEQATTAAPHTDDEIRALLHRLGDPAHIADEAHARLGTPRPAAGAVAGTALVLIGLSGLLTLDLFGLAWTSYAGWLLGLILLWFAHAWTRTEKLVASAALIAGIGVLPAVAQILWTQLAPACTIGAGSCPTSPSAPMQLATAAAWGIIPIATAVYLATRLRRRSLPAYA